MISTIEIIAVEGLKEAGTGEYFRSHELKQFSKEIGDAKDIGKDQRPNAHSLKIDLDPSHCFGLIESQTLVSYHFFFPPAQFCQNFANLSYLVRLEISHPGGFLLFSRMRKHL